MRIPILVLLAVLTVSCSTTRGSGTIKTETRSVTGVSRVSLVGDATLEIEQTGKDSLSITADDNILPLLLSEVHDGELILNVKRMNEVKPTDRIVYKLTVTGLTGLSLIGDSDANIKKLATDHLNLSITGDAKVQVNGTADLQEVTILGDGKVDGAGLSSKTAKVSITGDGILDIAVSEKLEVNIIGDGTINYTGDPTVTKTVIGDGKIEKKS
jgi:hypothetical protein